MYKVAVAKLIECIILAIIETFYILNLTFFPKNQKIVLSETLIPRLENYLISIAETPIVKLIFVLRKNSTIGIEVFIMPYRNNSEILIFINLLSVGFRY